MSFPTQYKGKCSKCDGLIAIRQLIAGPEGGPYHHAEEWVCESNNAQPASHVRMAGVCNHCGEYAAESLVLSEEAGEGLTPTTEVGWPEYLGDYDEGCDEDPCPFEKVEHWHVSSYCSPECLGWATDIDHAMSKD